LGGRALVFAPCERLGDPAREVRYWRISLKKSEKERNQKTRLWSCRADNATHCHHQFAAVAVHRKVSLSAETLSAFFLKPACCLKNCDRGKKSSFSTVSAHWRNSGGLIEYLLSICGHPIIAVGA
jgi:hypothetical protein